MLRITIELLPHGDEESARVIGVAHIANVGGTLETGDYDVTLFKSAEYAKSPGIWKRGKVTNFPRTRLGPWDLLFRSLRSAVGGRN